MSTQIKQDIVTIKRSMPNELLQRSRIFRKLNEHSKELQVKQGEIIKEYDSLAAQYEELEYLKNNMNDYLGRGNTDKNKESVIDTIKRHKAEEKEKPKEKIRISKNLFRVFVVE